MTAFGFSAFLKLVSQSERSQRTAIKNRLIPSDDGYDFHRSLRQKAAQLIAAREEFDRIFHSTATIRKPAERQSAQNGLTTLRDWLTDISDAKVSDKSSEFFTISNQFSVKFAPDFCANIEGTPTAIHIWNTMQPALALTQAYGALSLFQTEYNTLGLDIGILSLRNGRLYNLSTVPDHSEIGQAIIRRLEKVFAEVRRELGVPAPERRDRPGDRPRLTH